MAEVAENPDLGEIPLSGFDQKSVGKLGDLKSTRNIEKFGCFPGASEEHRTQFKQLVARHSRPVEGKQGTILFWPNEHVLHQAVHEPDNDPDLQGKYSRIVMVASTYQDSTVTR